MAAPAGIIGQTFSSGKQAQCNSVDSGTLENMRSKAEVEIGQDYPPTRRMHHRMHRARAQKIRIIREIRRRITRIVEELLPLAHHAQIAIVDQQEF